MATNKNDTNKSTQQDSASTHHERYEQAVQDFSSALALLHSQDYAQARDQFLAIVAANADEPTLIDRARTYAKICEQQLAPPEDSPETADDFYYRAVLLANDGDYDDALPLLERALVGMPDSPKVLFARASTWALKGNADAAVADLRRAIAVDPQVRFQAANDPDFEPIREEPAFIDIIEPTPSGS
jgi:tetratricopeptide (TPR) repeat protein